MASPVPVRDSVKQIDETSWLVGDKHIIRHFQEPYEGECLLKDSNNNSCYTISDASSTLPTTKPLPLDSHVRMIHDAGDASAVFNFGDTLILKVKLKRPGDPLEHEILAFLAQKQLSFSIATVLFRSEEVDRTYIFQPCMPGKRLNEFWWDMNADEKESVTTRIASICSELAAFPSDVMVVNDYNWMNPFLEPEQRDDSPEAFKKHCTDLGMDCSSFVFSHNDLGPTNILIDGDKITVLDWDLAGYYPREWVRTKWAVCGALEPERGSYKNIQCDGEYRKQVERKLGDMGFPEVTEAYKELWKIRREEWKKQRPWIE